MMVLLPLVPSTLTVIVVVPLARPMTNPVELTVATAVLELRQITVRPDVLNVCPRESRGMAIICFAWPTFSVYVRG